MLIPVQYLLIATNWYGLFSIFIPVYGFLFLPSISVLAHDTENFLERSAIQWGLMITVYCISHVPALLLLEIPGYTGETPLLMFYLILVVQMSDVLQYVFGKLFGKTKECAAPVVSLSKTVEGFVGGAVSATLIGAAMWWITPFTPLQSAGMALAIVLMGFLGGLVLSAVKRSLGAKDWGSMIEGHGGVMDRMDSVSFDVGGTDAGDGRQTGAGGLTVDVNGAGATEPDAATKLAALQVELVAQHPQQRHVTVNIDSPLCAIDLDRIGHRSRLWRPATYYCTHAAFAPSRHSRVSEVFANVG